MHVQLGWRGIPRFSAQLRGVGGRQKGDRAEAVVGQHEGPHLRRGRQRHDRPGGRIDHRKIIAQQKRCARDARRVVVLEGERGLRVVNGDPDPVVPWILVLRRCLQRVASHRNLVAIHEPDRLVAGPANGVVLNRVVAIRRPVRPNRPARNLAVGDLDVGTVRADARRCVRQVALTVDRQIFDFDAVDAGFQGNGCCVLLLAVAGMDDPKVPHFHPRHAGDNPDRFGLSVLRSRVDRHLIAPRGLHLQRGGDLDVFVGSVGTGTNVDRTEVRGVCCGDCVGEARVDVVRPRAVTVHRLARRRLAVGVHDEVTALCISLGDCGRDPDDRREEESCKQQTNRSRMLHDRRGRIWRQDGSRRERSGEETSAVCHPLKKYTEGLTPLVGRFLGVRPVRVPLLDGRRCCFVMGLARSDGANNLPAFREHLDSARPASPNTNPPPPHVETGAVSALGGKKRSA